MAREGGTDIQIRAYRESDQDDVVALWRECGLVVPWNDPVKDINRKLGIQRQLFLVGTLHSAVVATVMAGYEGHRGWVNYLAVATKYRKRGFARCLLDEAEELLRNMGCPKINLQVRSTNPDVVEFYRRIGYSVDDVVSMGKRLEQD